jgi:NTP pyrophosphatase (non-canonical NTP hydrolase)
MRPEYGKTFILYMIEEIGEVIAIIKKKEQDEIMRDPAIRERFVEELGDVIMYFADVLNRYEISAEEFSTACHKKFQSNMRRNFKQDHADFLKNGPEPL